MEKISYQIICSQQPLYKHLHNEWIWDFLYNCKIKEISSPIIYSKLHLAKVPFYKHLLSEISFQTELL